jgi:zinc-ribbon family
MLIIWGLRVIYHTIAQGVFYCRKCGGDRNYRHRAGRRFITVFFIPLIPLNKAGEHVQCTTCKTRYVPDVLNAPTAAKMQAAIPAGVRGMVCLMLTAGGADSPAARRRAIEMVKGAGELAYDEDRLVADMSQPADAHMLAISQFGGPLRPEAKEWHLAEMVRIALADAPRQLTAGERATVEAIAGALGMTRAQALGVIQLTEQAADQS